MHRDAPSFARSITDTALLAAALAIVWAAVTGPAAAQVQIKQVEETTGRIEGATQSEIIVAQDEGGVSRMDVTELIPAEAPGITDADGNSATVFQDGDDNEVAIEQTGTNNEASASQLGDDNEIVITQGGGPLPAAFSGDLPDDLSGREVFNIVRTFRPTGTGSGNLAVAVHEGTGNQTSITQLGTSNAAGIRLDGSDNTMNLLQTGSENRFLMDTAIDDLDMSILQNGSGNSLETNVPVNVQMNGNGIEMVIRRGASIPPGTGR